MAALRKLVIKPTGFCFHKCPYCDLRQDFYSEMLASAKDTAQQNKPGHLPLEQAKAQLHAAYQLGMRECLLSGGDPLLYPHLTELIRTARSLPGVFVFINSVGTGLTEGKAAEIIEAGLGAWNFSVDSLDADTYDVIRGVPGAFKQTMAAFETLRRIRKKSAQHVGFWINFMTVITRHNFRDLPRLIQFCLDNEVASVFLMNVYGDDQKREFLLSEDEIQEFRGVIVPNVVRTIAASTSNEIVKRNAVEVLRACHEPDAENCLYNVNTFRH